MKSSRKHDWSSNKHKWDKIFKKMNLLLKLIDACKPNRSIDDTDYRWVEDRIEYWNSDERILIKDEMRVANNLWQKYNGPINVVRNG